MIDPEPRRHSPRSPTCPAPWCDESRRSESQRRTPRHRRAPNTPACRLRRNISRRCRRSGGSGSDCRTDLPPAPILAVTEFGAFNLRLVLRSASLDRVCPPSRYGTRPIRLRGMPPISPSSCSRPAPAPARVALGTSAERPRRADSRTPSTLLGDSAGQSLCDGMGRAFGDTRSRATGVTGPAGMRVLRGPWPCG